MRNVWTENLFAEVLEAPATRGCNELHIVTGYAAATMASRHLSRLADVTRARLSVSLIVGMTPADGISPENHQGFQALAEDNPWANFQCSYVMRDRPPVHAKLYVWMQNGEPTEAYTGSANYTQNAFSGRQRELMTAADPIKGLRFYDALAAADTIFCDHGEVAEYVQLQAQRRFPGTGGAPSQEPASGGSSNNEGLASVVCSLMTSRGKMHRTAGLNWGQRLRRNSNEAYIPVTAKVARSGFFPPVGDHFMVLTDDDKSFICVRAQGEYGKAIETPANNSWLGEYFRRRLGLAGGVPVTEANLQRYGRTSVTFYKIDDGTYSMDFAPP